MKKLLLTVIILILMNIFAFYYLNILIDNKKSLDISINNDSIIYLNSDIELENIEDFKFNDYFITLKNNKYTYSLNKDNISIFHNNKEISFPITIIEKEEIQEEKENIKPITNVITQNKPIQEPTIKEPINTHTSNNNEYIDTYIPPSNDYLNVSNTSYSFNKGEDINNIIAHIQSSIDSSSAYSIDYFSLNPNIEGTYIVYINSDIASKEIVVNII